MPTTVIQPHGQIEIDAVLDPGCAGVYIADRGDRSLAGAPPDAVIVREGSIPVGIEAEVEAANVQQLKGEPVAVCARLDGAELGNTACRDREWGSACDAVANLILDGAEPVTGADHGDVIGSVAVIGGASAVVGVVVGSVVPRRN